MSFKGHKHAKATKDKISEKVSKSLIGNKRRWKGEEASRTAKHMWIYKQFGKANHCSNPNCDKKSNKYEWANISGEYKREIFDYKQLCVICHRKMDLRKEFCKSGHALNGDNLYINPRGHRECKQCRKESQRRFLYA